MPVALPGPAMQGCWGWMESHSSAQQLTALPHLQTAEGSANISAYVLAVNRFRESCQHPLVLMLLSGSDSPPCLLVPQALGMDVGRASCGRTGSRRKSTAGPLPGDSQGGGRFSSAQGVSLQGIFWVGVGVGVVGHLALRFSERNHGLRREGEMVPAWERSGRRGH